MYSISADRSGRPLHADQIAIADQYYLDHQHRIDRRSTRVAVMGPGVPYAANRDREPSRTGHQVIPRNSALQENPEKQTVSTYQTLVHHQPKPRRCNR